MFNKYLFNNNTQKKESNSDSSVSSIIGTPSNKIWFRVDGKSILTMCVLCIDNNWNKLYIVDPKIADKITIGKVFKAHICLAINNNQEPFLWVAKIPQYSNDSWGKTRMEILSIAKDRWVTMCGDSETSMYTCDSRDGEDRAPIWPSKPFKEIVQEAFQGCLIDDLSHEAFGSDQEVA